MLFTPYADQQPVFEVTAITMSDTLIYRNHMMTPFTDHQELPRLFHEAILYERLQAMGIRVHDVAFPNGGGCPALCAIQIEPRRRWARSTDALLSVLGSSFMNAKMVVAVDPDIDIHDPRDIQYALATRVDPEPGRASSSPTRVAGRSIPAPARSWRPARGRPGRASRASSDAGASTPPSRSPTAAASAPTTSGPGPSTGASSTWPTSSSVGRRSHDRSHWNADGAEPAPRPAIDAVLVDWRADWCTNCAAQEKVIERLAPELEGQVTIGMIDVGSLSRVGRRVRRPEPADPGRLRRRREVRTLHGYRRAPEIRDTVHRALSGAQPGRSPSDHAQA